MEGERPCEREGGTGRESEGRSYPSSISADSDFVSSVAGLSRKAGQSAAEAEVETCQFSIEPCDATLCSSSGRLVVHTSWTAAQVPAYLPTCVSTYLGQEPTCGLSRYATGMTRGGSPPRIALLAHRRNLIPGHIERCPRSRLMI